MQKPKLLIFLHGLWFDKNNNKESIQQLANWLWIEYIWINWPFSSQRERGGFSWTWLDPIKKRSIADKKIDESIVYTKNIINKELKKRKIKWENLILCGRSQWWLIAIKTWLENDKKCHSIISLCSGIIPWCTIKNKTDNKIIRIEAKNDILLSQEKKDSYKKLEQDWIKIDYILDPKSDHDNISQNAINQIIKKILNPNRLNIWKRNVPDES